MVYEIFLDKNIPNGIFLSMNDAITSKAERTRRYIIEKVAPVFNKKGYAATSMSDLISATGLSKGSIYGNFKNKDEVALAAFEFNADFINSNLRARMASASSQREKLLAYAETFRAIHRDVMAKGGCPILNTAVDSSELNFLLQKAVQYRIGGWQRAIIGIIEKGVQNGEFPADVEARQIAQVMICLIEGGYAMSKATQDSSFLVSALKQMEHMIHSL